MYNLIEMHANAKNACIYIFTVCFEINEIVIIEMYELIISRLYML